MKQFVVMWSGGFGGGSGVYVLKLKGGLVTCAPDYRLFYI
jgi:hypothetical protein